MHLLEILVAAGLFAGANAFPAVAEEHVRRTGLPVGEHETNAGFFPSHTFSAEKQFVDVRPGSGHEWVAPAATDLRGPCPGLNACANHKFIDHTGVLDLTDTTSGLSKCLSFDPDFGAPLFVFAIFNSGNIIQMKWSIGGPMKATGVTAGPGGGLGISNSHNKYEGDASPGRGDAYLHNGDSHSLNIDNFNKMYELANSAGEFTFQTLRAHAIAGQKFSHSNNPYFFAGGTFFVSPIAHQFVVAMMSNHSAENVGGFLTKDVLKSFFSVKQDKKGANYWVPGHDRIPLNWYKRPVDNQYGILASFGDFGISAAEYPPFLDVGGNMGKVNDFVGIDISDLTGGAFNAKTLLQGNNLACFAFEALTFANPGLAGLLAGGNSPFASLANKVLGATKLKLNCPQVSEFKTQNFEKYPGYQYKQPLQPSTPY